VSEVSSWSTTAASNNSASPDGFPEAMAPSGVNDSARELMASIKRWRDDISCTVTAGGTANAITVAAAQTISAYAAGQVFSFIAASANTGAVTLNVDSVGAKAVKKHHDVALSANDIESGQLVVVAYRATEDVFQMLSPTAAEHYRNVNTLTAAPVVGDDSADGYQPGSIAVDVTNDRAYICVDASAGAAVWKEASNRVIQAVEATPYTTYTNISVQIPADDTVPQNTEGVELCTAAITPTSAASRLVIEAEMFGAVGAAGVVCAALFQDSTANAIAVSASRPAAQEFANIKLRHEMAAGTTSATTFKLRAGPSAGAGNFYVNGSTTTRLFGGLAAVRLRVTEYA